MGLRERARSERHVNLYAALDAATGRVHAGATAPCEKTEKGFVAFMGDLLRELPDADECRVVMDNHAIHM